MSDEAVMSRSFQLAGLTLALVFSLSTCTLGREKCKNELADLPLGYAQISAEAIFSKDDKGIQSSIVSGRCNTVFKQVVLPDLVVDKMRSIAMTKRTPDRFGIVRLKGNFFIYIFKDGGERGMFVLDYDPT